MSAGFMARFGITGTLLITLIMKVSTKEAYYKVNGFLQKSQYTLLAKDSFL